VRDAADDLAYPGNAGILFGLNVGAIAVGEGIKGYGGKPKFLDAALVSTEAQLLTAGSPRASRRGPGGRARGPRTIRSTSSRAATPCNIQVSPVEYRI
jgi:hypothetical protein